MVSVSDNGVTGVSFFVVTHEMYGFYNWHTAGLGITLSLFITHACLLLWFITPSPPFTVPSGQTTDRPLTVSLLWG